MHYCVSSNIAYTLPASGPPPGLHVGLHYLLTKFQPASARHVFNSAVSGNSFGNLIIKLLDESLVIDNTVTCLHFFLSLYHYQYFPEIPDKEQPPKCMLINILILPCNAYSSIVGELATSIYTGDFVPVYERGKKSIRMFSCLVQIFCLDFCFFWHFWIGSMDGG